MAGPLRVLIVEDSEDDAALLVRELARGGWQPAAARVDGAETFGAALERQRWDLVLADYALPGFSALEALDVLRRRGLDVPFIVVSGRIGEETAVSVMKAGAHDYLMKNNLARLVPAIEREVREAAERHHRARAEAALVEAHDYARLLLEGANALIVGLDAAARITIFNRAAEEVTGYRREEVQGRDWFDVVVPRARFPRVWEVFQSYLASGEPHDFENPIVTAAGEERIIAWRNSLLRSGGAVVGVLAFGIDVTVQQRAAAERLALEQAARRAEKLAALGTLAAGLAHELNNPIGIISSRIELMLLEDERRRLPPAVREDLRVLHRHAQRVARTTQGLLSFARHSSGERLPVQLNDVVQETLLLAGRQIRKEGIRITTRLAPDLPPILGDPNTLQQVTLNLLTNARDAVDSGGQIVIETRCGGAGRRAVQVVVEDTGRGIPSDDIPKIFDPFFSTKPRGTGLGLAITDGIVREHGGTIDVESVVGRGTRVVVTFPVPGGARPGGSAPA